AILSKTAQLNETLRSSIALSQNRQMMALGLDAGVKTAIREMQRNAADRMDYYLYLVRKAFMYEQLRPVGPGLANVNQFVARCDDWIANNRKTVRSLAGSKTDWATDPCGYLAEIDRLSGSDFGQFGNQVLTETLGELAKQIVDHRNRFGPETSSEYHVTFDPAMSSQLAGGDTLHIDEITLLFPNFAQIFSSHSSIRVSNIAMDDDDLLVRCPDDFDGPLRLEITFGEEFVLRDAEKNFFQFRISEAEKPIQYGFTINNLGKDPASPGAKTGKIKGDQKNEVDEMFKTIMSKHFNDTHGYREMLPSILSSLDLAITLGGEYVEKVERLRLKITLSFD
ncbi:MAG: hypothetical protein ABWY00_04015, partial [Dongiaceae bacterium]